MEPEKRRIMDRIFNPRGMALFGGIGTPGAFGYLIALSNIRYGYKGALYPISSKGGEIAGHRIYKSLDDVDGPVDLASISVPARAVPAVLRDCLKHGVAGVQIHSSGFAEVGTREGISLQEEIIRIAQHGLRIVGPNCFGIHCPRGGITLLPGSGFAKEPGNIAFISQSGGVATDFGYEAGSARLGISKVVSFGNGCDVDAIELLDYLGDDPETQYIGAYLEGVRDGRCFLDNLRRISTTKPVVIWKGGLTPLGHYLIEMLDILTDLKQKTDKEIVAVFENRANQVDDVSVEKVSRELRAAYLERGIPVFASVERALRGIRHAVTAAEVKKQLI